jgi:hypothetical protein
MEFELSQNMQIVATLIPTSFWCHHWCLYMDHLVFKSIIDYIKVGTISRNQP